MRSAMPRKSLSAGYDVQKIADELLKQNYIYEKLYGNVQLFLLLADVYREQPGSAGDRRSIPQRERNLVLRR